MMETFNHRKKDIYTVASVFLALLIILLVALTYHPQKASDELPGQTIALDPNDYVQERVWKHPDQNISIRYQTVDVITATDGQSHMYFDYQAYRRLDGETIDIILWGSYRGSYSFKYKYVEDGIIKMMIGSEFITYDEVPQAFAFLKDSGAHHTIVIFVDKLWLDTFGDQYAVWSDDIQNGTIKEERLEFTDLGNGVYTASIKDNFEWMLWQNPVRGRFYFGDMSKSEYLHARSTGENDHTIIMMS